MSDLVPRYVERDLLAVFSGDRDEHVCPFGKTELVKSRDNGKTWSKQSTINDFPLDDRDAGIIQTIKWTLLVTWFTSIAFAQKTNLYRQYYGDKIVDGWQKAIWDATPKVVKQWLGSWTRRSIDNGKTWDKPVRLAASTPHGAIQLRDGRLLYVGMDLYGKYRVIVEESRNDGRSWKMIGSIPTPKNKSGNHYHEPHVVETHSGKLVAQIRYTPPTTQRTFSSSRKVTTAVRPGQPRMPRRYGDTRPT